LVSRRKHFGQGCSRLRKEKRTQEKRREEKRKEETDLISIRMTPALRKVRAHAKNVAVHERNGCLCTYKSFESFDFGIVDPHHHLMTVDESSIGAVEQDAAVADHSTRVVRSSLLLLLLHRSCYC